MRRSRKLILIALLAVVVLAGSIGGAALAQAEDEDSSQPETLLTRVAEILGIDQQELENAFAQARSETKDEHLQYMIDQGIITQEQADEHKTWMESRPDTTFGLGGHGHGGHRGFGMHGGGFPKWGGPCAPQIN